MAETITRICNQCGKTTEGFAGPVEPADPNTSPPNDPPGTGWYRVAGPSYGMGWPEWEALCSETCVRAMLTGEPSAKSATRILKGWKAIPQANTSSKRRGKSMRGEEAS